MGRSYVDRADLAPDEYYSSGARKVFGSLPPGGDANLTTLTHLGGGSDPPSKKFNTLGGGV